ncbi:hypothetical protein BDD12DRAFT_809093 [Trichophaea hybrida]|nr:hypothetical protein BDD12DRAFT_809093 [Trichophaea hybrida]
MSEILLDEQRWMRSNNPFDGISRRQQSGAPSPSTLEEPTDFGLERSAAQLPNMQSESSVPSPVSRSSDNAPSESTSNDASLVHTESVADQKRTPDRLKIAKAASKYPWLFRAHEEGYAPDVAVIKTALQDIISGGDIRDYFAVATGEELDVLATMRDIVDLARNDAVANVKEGCEGEKEVAISME